MKRTPEDAAFAVEFGRELYVKYSDAKTRGVTDDVFAKSIGVVRAQLDKYLRGEAVPSVRTVALAHAGYGIAVAYDGSTGFQGLRRTAAPKGTREHRSVGVAFYDMGGGPGQVRRQTAARICS